MKMSNGRPQSRINWTHVVGWERWMAEAIDQDCFSLNFTFGDGTINQVPASAWHMAQGLRDVRKALRNMLHNLFAIKFFLKCAKSTRHSTAHSGSWGNKKQWCLALKKGGRKENACRWVLVPFDCISLHCKVLPFRSSYDPSVALLFLAGIAEIVNGSWNFLATNGTKSTWQKKPTKFMP